MFTKYGKYYEKVILENENNLDELQAMSQHKNKENAFFNIDMGGWKHGIWGLCPSEILHQFYEGVLSYELEEFVYETLSERYRKGLTDVIAKIIDVCRNLGDKYKYPNGTFSMGITKFAKMKRY